MFQNTDRREAERLHVLEELQIIDSEPEEEPYRAVVEAAAALVDAPSAVMSLVSRERQWFKASRGVTVRETPRAIACCAHTIAGSTPMLIEDLTEDPRFRDNPLVVGPPFIRSYAGAPIRVDGQSVGAVAVFDTRVRQWRQADGQGLSRLASVAANALVHRRSAAREVLARDACRMARVGGWSHHLASDRVYWSDEACRIHEMPPGTSPTRWESMAFVVPGDRELLEALGRRCASERTPYDVRLRLRTARGRIRQVRATGEAVVDSATGQVVRIQGAIYDLTDYLRFEEALIRAERIETTGLMASSIAHDLRGLLSPLGLAASLLRDPETSALERGEFLDIIDDCVARGATMLDRLLGFVRGKDLPESEWLPVQQLLSDLRPLVESLLGPGITLVHQGRSAEAIVRGHLGQLQQVVLSLAMNARDAMPEGGTLTMQAEKALAPDGTPSVCIELRDTGEGIAPEMLEHVFDPLFTTKERTTGLGIGLATALAIVEGHGGTITVESPCGHGSTFRVWLPLPEAMS